MTMLEIHAAALRSVSTAYHEFLLRYNASADIVYGIVEGRDDPMFYRGLIERYLPIGWDVELVPAGCKDNVLRAIAAFDWTRFSPKRICFFVDRDLSDFVSAITVTAENLYVTDNYSIENDLVDFGVFKRFLAEVLNVGDLRPSESEAIEQRFTSALAVFRETMVAIMTQVIVWQRDGKRPCLNDIRPKDFFVFSDGYINVRSDFPSALSVLQHTGKCVSLQLSEQAKLCIAETEFRQARGGERFVRGKYLLWFFVEFALQIHRSIPLFVTRLKAPPRPRVSIGPGNAMVLLAPRARCPMSLVRFLGSTYENYICKKALLQSVAVNSPEGGNAPGVG